MLREEKSFTTLQTENKRLRILLLISLFLLIISFSFLIYGYYRTTSVIEYDYIDDRETNEEDIQGQIETSFKDNSLIFVDNINNHEIKVGGIFFDTEHSDGIETIEDPAWSKYLAITTRDNLDGGVSDTISYYHDIATLIQVLSNDKSQELNSLNDLEEVLGEENAFYIKKPNSESSEGIVLITEPVDIINNYKALRSITFYNESDDKTYTYDPDKYSKNFRTTCIIDLSYISKDSQGYIGYSIRQATHTHIDSCERLNLREDFIIEVY